MTNQAEDSGAKRLNPLTLMAGAGITQPVSAPPERPETGKTLADYYKPSGPAPEPEAPADPAPKSKSTRKTTREPKA